MEVGQVITLEEVKKSNPQMIWYAVNSCWWTHDPKHVEKLPNGAPIDPLGGPIRSTRVDGALKYLARAEKYALQYGKHGIRAFMAAHRLNSFKSPTSLSPWAATTWDEYNDALDRFDAKLKNLCGFAKMKLEEVQNSSVCRKSSSRSGEGCFDPENM